MRNKTFFGAILIIFCTCASCWIRKPDDTLFQPNEFINLKLVDGQRFKYLHYKLDDSQLTYIYCEGTYIKKDDIYTIYPVSLDSRDYRCETKQSYNDSIGSKTRIKISTNITSLSSGRVKEYKMIIHLDSKEIVANGIKADTTIDRGLAKTFYVELFFPDAYIFGSQPPPTYESIRSQNIIFDENSNFVNVQFPVTYEDFFYKNIGITQIKDGGRYWIMGDGSKIKKGKILLN
jgi:hypothetical protein